MLRRFQFRSSMALLLLGIAFAIRAEEEPLKRIPAPFMTYHGAPWLERHEREEEEHPDEVINAMGLKPGDVVADIGCGTGYFARRMAKRVLPGGKVYGVDIQPEMIELLKKAAEKDGAGNVIPVLSAEDDPKLPQGEVDWMILVDVYHEFSEPERMLAKMRAALAPGGRVALVEYRVEDGTGDHIKPDHRMSARQVMIEWEAAGFELVDLHEFLPHQHLFIFRSSSASPDPPKPITRVELRAASDQGKVKLESVRADGDSITVKIARTVDERLLITTPAGQYFRSADGTADRVAHRDGAIGLFDDGAKDWRILAVPAAADRARQASDPIRFEIEPTSNRPDLRRAMFYIQSGGLPVDTARAAARILSADSRLEELRGLRPQSIALALLACDQAGVKIEERAIWRDRQNLLDALGEGNLKQWLRERAESPPPTSE